MQPSNREIMNVHMNNSLYASELLTAGNYTLAFGSGLRIRIFLSNLDPYFEYGQIKENRYYYR